MTFGCNDLTESGFGVDFGEFSDIKAWLSHWFDHTTLINEDDPELHLFQELHDKEICRFTCSTQCEHGTNRRVRLRLCGYLDTQTHEQSVVLN